MIYGRYFHEIVSMANKMFVIGGQDLEYCEVFDSFSRTFTLIKRIPSHGNILESDIVTNVGNKFTVYFTCTRDSSIYCYDIVAEEWHKENKKLEKVNYVFTPMKVPTT